MRYTLNFKKKTQRDLEIIACGLNSKKKPKKKPNLCRSQEMRESLSNYKKKSAGFGLYLRSDFSVVKMNVSP